MGNRLNCCWLSRCGRAPFRVTHREICCVCLTDCSVPSYHWVYERTKRVRARVKTPYWSSVGFNILTTGKDAQSFWMSVDRVSGLVSMHYVLTLWQTFRQSNPKRAHDFNAFKLLVNITVFLLDWQKDVISIRCNSSVLSALLIQILSSHS